MGLEWDRGAGSRLPTAVLLSAGISTLVAVVVSAISIYLQLKNYRKPILQRMVVRIMLMVPIYAISSFIALFSLDAAFVIDALRDIYEAFVIYCFFHLLLSYLGGERSLLILMHGRPPKAPFFPVNLFSREIDVSDPHTFLFLKRGILQYVQVKPVLAVVTLILKAFGKYNEGDFRANSGYLYVSIVYNISICLALYCLAIFWLCVHDDLKPFRPVPKFLCVKGILFFSFWQSTGISSLVAMGAITRLGPYTDAEHISLGLTDTMICLEMPFFAFAHMYAFSDKDYVDPHRSYVARMPMYYAFRDAFGIRDVIEDSKATLRGEGMDYREYEPAEGLMHQGAGRDRRIRAGLRYSKGGQRKYWLPQRAEATQASGRLERGVDRAIRKVAGQDQGYDPSHAPLFARDVEDTVHLAPDLQDSDDDPDLWDSAMSEVGYELPFGDLDDADEALFEHSKKYLFGDYNYPVIDISSETARGTMWQEEERVLRNERGAWFSPLRGARGQAALQQRSGPAWQGYGSVATSDPGSRGRATESYDGSGDRSPRIIDHEQGRTPASEPADLKLGWTNVRGKSTPSASKSHSHSPQIHSRPVRRSEPPSAPSSAEGGTKAASRLHVPPIRSRNTSKPRGASTSRSPVVQPDAVDLVVEDDDAALEDQSRERRKGEPAIRGPGLRRVYKRGFVIDSEDGEKTDGEHEGREPDEEERREAGYESPEETRTQRGDLHEDSDGHQATLDPEGIVARAGTPPLHARITFTEYDEDNPWA
ncbi:putative organic solute transporter Ostalpha [Lyophyllum shimeji]|uniref:Organic solute transporter Ostalpha n=1 Tax=Lyophyllum shimeji TaxID=47721 RepID=A0A9P3US62_LYOSH|nr:putative organic solute transporter Ostalpha [Lyophyllum shimeji]